MKKLFTLLFFALSIMCINATEFKLTGDTITLHHPYGLMVEYVRFTQYGTNRLIFRENLGVTTSQDTAKYTVQVYFDTYTVTPGIYTLENGRYADYTGIVKENAPTSIIDKTAHSTLKVTKSTDGGTTFFDLCLVGDDGNVYRANSYFTMPTVASDTMLFDFLYDQSKGWDMGVMVDTINVPAAGWVTFKTYCIFTDTQGYLYDAYWMTLGVNVQNETYIGHYNTSFLHSDYCSFYNAWFQYSLCLIDVNFDISDSDGDGLGDLISGHVVTNDGYIHPFIMPFVHPKQTFKDSKQLYILGDFQNWDPNSGIEMKPVPGQKGVFTYDYSYNSTGWFTFVTKLSPYWNVVNACRFGPEHDSDLPSIGTGISNTLYTNANAFQIPSGDYIFTVNLNTMTFVAERKLTALEDAVDNTSLKKVFKDGHIIIKRNGEQYNITGIKL